MQEAGDSDGLHGWVVEDEKRKHRLELHWLVGEVAAGVPSAGRPGEKAESARDLGQHVAHSAQRGHQPPPDRRSGSNGAKGAVQRLNGHGLLATDKCAGLCTSTPCARRAFGRASATRI